MPDVTLPDQSVENTQASHVARGQSLYTIHELSRLISMVYDKRVSQYGLTRSRWWALMHISENEGRSQSSLAGVLGLGRAAAGRQLSKMEELGLIERRPDPSDSRVRRIYKTPLAETMMVPMQEAGVAMFDELFSDFSEEEEEMLLDMLTRIKKNTTIANKD